MTPTSSRRVSSAFYSLVQILQYQQPAAHSGGFPYSSSSLHATPLLAEFIEAIARSAAESSLLEESRKLRQTALIYDLLRLVGAENHCQQLLHGLSTDLDAQLFLMDEQCLHSWRPDSAELPGPLAWKLEK